MIIWLEEILDSKSINIRSNTVQSVAKGQVQKSMVSVRIQ